MGLGGLATLLIGRLRRLGTALLACATALAPATPGAARPREPPLRVTVAPPVDPWGRPWKLSVSASAPEPRLYAEATSQSGDGEWIVARLPPGSLQVEIHDRGGTLWLRREVDESRGSGPLRLHVPRLPVAGRLSRGAEGVAARLLFTAGDDRRVWMESDAGGHFRGDLPVLEGGEWDVEVRGRHPPLRRRLQAVLRPRAPEDVDTWLELDLGDTGLAGCVVTENGQPRRDVLVRAEEVASGAPVQALTNGDGCFDLGALPAGSYRVWAESGDGFSAAREMEVVAGGQPDLELVLKPRRRLAGRVVSDAGPVKAASVQTWLSPGVPRGDRTLAQGGLFQVDLPGDEGEIGVTVIAAGFAITMIRLWPQGDEPVEVPVSREMGALIVELPAPALDAADGRAVALSHGGTVERLDYLGQWGTVQELSNGGRRVTLAHMAPGEYTACFLAPPEWPALWAGISPAQRCTFGRLGTGERLTLVLGSPDASALSR